MFKVNRLYKKLGKREILNGITTTFYNNGVSVIVGINGAGKTTFLDTIVGILKKDGGSIELNGFTPENKKFKEQVFYIPSDFYLPEYMTAKEYSKFILNHYPNSKYSIFLQCAKWLEIDKYLNKTIETYSYGMKKKIQLAIMAASDVSLILVDEVFNGLDFETSILVQKMLSELGKKKKVIIVSHEPSILKTFPTDIRLMKNGKIVEVSGTAEEIVEKIKKEGNLYSKLQKMEKYF